MPSQNEIRQNITNQIIAALAAGTAPWRRPWNSDSNAGAPTNAVSGKRYSGVNPLLLQIAADHFGFKGKYWGTYRQWSELGGQVKSRPSDVKAGDWGTGIVFCKPCLKKTRDNNGNEVEDKFWMLRTFTVFNIDRQSMACRNRRLIFVALLDRRSRFHVRCNRRVGRQREVRTSHHRRRQGSRRLQP